MEKKYLFFDIDGTLTDRSTGEIVPSAREALTRLEEMDISLRSQLDALTTKQENSQMPMDLRTWYVVEEMAVS
jgi:FMN phosphatase YigB (HAD superfamily)